MIALYIAPKEEKQTVKNLLQFCLYDYTIFDHNNLNQHAEFDYIYLDQYWIEENRRPYIVKENDNIIGLLLIRLAGDNEYNEIAEFFIANAYKNKGYGKRAIDMLFTMHKGKWKLTYNIKNKTGEKFWNKIIGEITQNNYINRSEESSKETITFTI